MPAPLAVIDMNVWLDYFRDDEPPVLEAQRDRLREATRRGLVRPMLTASLSAELAGACGPEGYDRFCEIMLVAWEVCEERVLANVHERCAKEIFWERKLTLEQALVPLAARRLYRDRYMLDAEWSRGIAATVAATLDENKEEEKAKKRGTIAELDARDAEAAKEAAEAADGRTVTPWRETIMRDDAAREELILDWALDEMVTYAMHVGLPFVRARLPDPRRLPSFYIPKLIHVRRIHGILIEGLSPVKVGLFDLAALDGACCYADVLATSDGRLTDLAERVKAPVAVLNFEAWDAKLAAMLTPA